MIIPPSVDHVLSELSSISPPSWVAVHHTAYSFIELQKPLHYFKVVIHEGVIYLNRFLFSHLKNEGINCSELDNGPQK